MSVSLTKARVWEAKCPRCKNIAISNKKNNGCPNCHSKISLYTPYSNVDWQSEDAKLSWRQIKCDKSCGWWVNEWDCPSCSAKIRGNYFRDKSAIFDIAIFGVGLILVLSLIMIWFIMTLAQSPGIN